MINRRSEVEETVTATVRIEDVKHFVGHAVWAKPANMGYSTQGYHRLIRVVERQTGSKYFPFEFAAWIEYQGEAHEVLLPQACTVQNVPKAQCNPVDLGEGATWWEWIPPLKQLAIF